MFLILYCHGCLSIPPSFHIFDCSVEPCLYESVPICTVGGIICNQCTLLDIYILNVFTCTSFKSEYLWKTQSNVPLQRVALNQLETELVDVF